MEQQDASAGGPPPENESAAYRAALEPALGGPDVRRNLRTFVILALVTWVPLLLLCSTTRLALGSRVEVPLLRDPGIYGRYVIALPLLVLAEVIVATSLTVQTVYLRDSGLVPPRERTRYDSAKEMLVRWYGSTTVQAGILVVSYTAVILLRTLVAYCPGASSWERLSKAEGASITLAGWWSILVCLPILVFLLLRWLWRACAWAWFLFRVSRLDLELTATHADRAGGLGFLAWGQASFAPVLAAISAVLCGSLAGEILYAGESVDSVKYHYMAFVAAGLLFLLVPLLAFSHRLAHCRFRALLDFGTMVWRHDRAFEEKWVRNPATKQENLLGNPDVSSLSAIGVAFDHVARMRVMPFDPQAVIVLFAAAVIPMLPFLAASVPLKDFLKRLLVFLV